MTSFILVVCGLVFGTICLGAGYVLGKKAKVIARAKELAGKAIDLSTEKLDSINPNK